MPYFQNNYPASAKNRGGARLNLYGERSDSFCSFSRDQPPFSSGCFLSLSSQAKILSSLSSGPQSSLPALFSCAQPLSPFSQAHFQPFHAQSYPFQPFFSSL